MRLEGQTSKLGNILSTLLAGMAEFEREPIRERTGEGCARPMANGVKFGREPKVSLYQRTEAIKGRSAGETLAAIAKTYGVAVSDPLPSSFVVLNSATCLRNRNMTTEIQP